MAEQAAESDEQVINEDTEESFTESGARTDDSIRELTTRLAGNLKGTIASFLGEYEPSPLMTHAESEKMSKEIQIYLADPEAPEFLVWVENFNLDEHSHDISERLQADQFLREVHSQLGMFSGKCVMEWLISWGITLVPDRVSSNEFWRRYYYAAHQAELTEKKRADILARMYLVREHSRMWIDWVRHRGQCCYLSSYGRR